MVCWLAALLVCLVVRMLGFVSFLCLLFVLFCLLSRYLSSGSASVSLCASVPDSALLSFSLCYLLVLSWHMFCLFVLFVCLFVGLVGLVCFVCFVFLFFISA